jgi:hypothetical protein
MAPPIKTKLSAEERRLGLAILDDALAGRRLRPEVVRKIQGEITRLSGPSHPPHVRAFARRMLIDHPELGA